MDIEQLRRCTLSEYELHSSTHTAFDHFPGKRQDMHIHVSIYTKNCADIELKETPCNKMEGWYFASIEGTIEN